LLALDSKLPGGHCLTHIDREGFAVATLTGRALTWLVSVGSYQTTVVSETRRERVWAGMRVAVC
jgi:hypothetical protein